MEVMERACMVCAVAKGAMVNSAESAMRPRVAWRVVFISLHTRD
jgi:hypothetical protein